MVTESGTHLLLLTQRSPSAGPLRARPAQARGKVARGQTSQKGISGPPGVHPVIPPHPPPTPQLLHSGPRTPRDTWVPTYQPQFLERNPGVRSPPCGPVGREPRLQSLPAALFLSHCVWDRGGARASTGEPPPLPKEKAGLCSERQS